MKKLIIYIAETTDNAQYRYRCENVAEATNLSSNFEVKIFLKKEIDEAEQLLDQASLVVIERQTAKDGIIPAFIKKAQAAGIKVVFDIDDLVFDYKDLPLLMYSTRGRNIGYWMGYFWGIRNIAKKVDGFITTNDFLGKKLKRTFNKPYKVIFNSLNNAQIEESKKHLDKKPLGFKIGYFSGSPTHIKDFRLAESDLLEFLDRHKEATLEVVGYMKFSTKAEKYIKAGRIKTYGPVPYLKMLEMVAKVDVNIAPLLVSDFSNCKSELKFFEAAVVETTTVASPIYSFKKAISDGENGFFAKPGEWLDKLEYLYTHPDDNKKVAKAARKYALEHYAGKEFLKQIEEAYGYFAK